MLKHYIFIFYFIFFLITSLNADILWLTLGDNFDDIRKFMIHDSTRALVATSKGVFLWDDDYPDATWPLADQSFTLPVNDIIELDRDRIIALVEDENKINSVYMGEFNQNSNSYKFTKINKENMHYPPKTIALNKNEGKIFIAAWDGIYLAHGDFKDLHQIATWPFSSQNLVCSLLWIEESKTLLGAWYDESDPRGNYIKIVSDSIMTSLDDLSITSMTERDELTIYRIYISTSDGKIFSVTPNTFKDYDDRNYPGEKCTYLKYAYNPCQGLIFEKDVLFAVDKRKIYVYENAIWDLFYEFDEEIRRIDICPKPLLNFAFGITVCTKDKVFILCPIWSIGDKNDKDSFINSGISYNRIGLDFLVQVPSTIRIDLFSVSGQKIRVLYNGYCLPGKHFVELDKSIEFGTYVVRFKNEESSVYKKICLIK